MNSFFMPENIYFNYTCYNMMSERSGVILPPLLTANVSQMSLYKIAAAGLLTGVTGTGIGGLAAFLPMSASRRVRSTLLEFTTGLMISMVCMELLPEGYKPQEFTYTTIGLVFGIILIIALDEYIKFLIKKRGGNPVMLSGWMVVFAVSLHNLPEGFAVGAGFQTGAAVGYTLSIAILLHDIPEGMAMAIPLRIGKMKPLKAFLITLLSAVPMGVGAFAGAAFGSISDVFFPLFVLVLPGAQCYM
jgi:ZIP family zinc transporter